MLVRVFVVLAAIVVAGTGCRSSRQRATPSGGTAMPTVKNGGFDLKVDDKECSPAVLTSSRKMDEEIVRRMGLYGFRFSDTNADVQMRGNGIIEKCKGDIGVLTVNLVFTSREGIQVATIERRFKLDAGDVDRLNRTRGAGAEWLAVQAQRSPKLSKFASSSAPPPAAVASADPEPAPSGKRADPAPAAPEPAPAPKVVSSGALDPTWIIAVMDVTDVNRGDVKREVGQSLVMNLGSQLRVFLAQRGVKTVDKSAQEAAMREQAADMKKESYEACYDSSCQVELGKALSASHILRSQITRFGKECVLSAELFELYREVIVGASYARGNCEPEGFLSMCQDVVTALGVKK